MLELLISRLRLIFYVVLRPRKFATALWVITIKGPDEFKERISLNYRRSNYLSESSIFYKKWFKHNYPVKKELLLQKRKIKSFKYAPKISLIIPTFNTPLNFLRECLGSVINQSYENWEICLADDCSSDKKVREIIKEYAKQDKRIKYVFRKTRGHISKASNSALKIATGEYIGLLDHDDLLWPNSLFEVVKVLNNNPQLDFIYSDEDKLSVDSKIHFEPFFKPDWNPDYLRSINYIVHFSVIRNSVIKKIGGFRSKYDGAQDWDLFLRAARETEKIYHIPNILYSWRVSKTSASGTEAMNAKPYAFRNQAKVLKDDLTVRGYQGKIIPTDILGVWRVKYKLAKNPLVSIIIPTKDNYKYIKDCLDSVLKLSTYKNYELIIVDTGSEDKRVFDLYKEVKKRHEKTKILNWKKEFNFSQVCNYGAVSSQGEFLLFLNNDTRVISSDWIESMLEHAERKEIGAVGCKLLYAGDKIQHAGVILGMKNRKAGIRGIAGHIFRGLPDHYFKSHLIDSVRNYSAVTGACLMISREKFNKVGGFDQKFRIAFNDVDFCLKLIKAGYLNIYTPYSVLYHFESLTIGQIGDKRRNVKEFKKEVNEMYKRWKEIIDNDPSFNINLAKDAENFSIKI